MKEKKQLETETKIKSTDKQIEAKSFPSHGHPARLGRLRLWLPDCLEPINEATHF